MRLQSIQLTNFLAHSTAKIDISPDAHLIVVCGPNGAGKSAVAHGIRAALTGDPVRGLSKKNELSRLVKLGAAQGKVSLSTEGGVYELNLANGKHAFPSDPHSPSLKFLLDPTLFPSAAMDESARRTALRQAAGVKLNPSMIADDLIAAGHDPKRVERIKSLLSTGFDLPEKEAAKGATEARGVWKSITGETYGDQKGGTWRAPGEAWTEADDTVLANGMESVNAARALQITARESLAVLQGIEAAHVAAEGRTEEAQGINEAFEEMQRLDRLVAEIRRERDELKELEDTASDELVTHPCPCCNASLTMRDGVLVDASTVTVQRRSKKRADRIEELNRLGREQTVKLEAAKALLHRLQALLEVREDLAKRPTSDELMAAGLLVSDLSEKITEAEAAVMTLRQHKQASLVAKENEAKALAAHEDVQAFKALEEALHDAPAKYMAKALDPVRDCMAYIATEAFGLDPDELTLSGDDMTMYYRGVPYPLASKSEQWRMEVAMAYAIAVVSQVNFLLADEFDVIQPSDRGAILDFFSEEKDVQTFLMGTLKSDPSEALIDGGVSIWLGQ